MQHNAANAEIAYNRLLRTMEASLLGELAENDRRVIQQARMILLNIDPTRPPKDMPVKKLPDWTIYAVLGGAFLLALLIGIIIGTLAGPQ